MASDIEQNITPTSVSFSLNVVATDTESKTASTAISVSYTHSCKGIPSFLYVSNNFGSKSFRSLGLSLKLLGAE